MKIFTLLTLLISTQAFAAPMHIGSADACGIKELDQERGKTACICEVMAKENWNKREYPFYKLGCSKWLAGQRCDIKKIVDQGTHIDPFLSSIEDLSVIKVGYVGHWASADQTIGYLDERLVPLATVHKAKVHFDNTACSGASDPISVRNYLNELPESLRSKISVKANQIVSVGEWDGILSPFMKANVEITMCEKGLEVPACKSFRNKGCSISLNHKDEIGCIDNRTGGQFRVLKCIRKNRNQDKDIKRLELGNWRELDMRNLGADIIGISLEDVMPTQFLKVRAEFDVTGPKLKELGWEGEELVTFKETQKIFAPFKVAANPMTEESQEYLRQVVGPSYQVDEDLPTRVIIEENMSGEIPQGSNQIYALVPKNPNHKIRISTNLEKLDYFQEAANPIINFYLMHRDPIEGKLSSTIKKYLGL